MPPKIASLRCQSCCRCWRNTFRGGVRLFRQCSRGVCPYLAMHRSFADAGGMHPHGMGFLRIAAWLSRRGGRTPPCRLAFPMDGGDEGVFEVEDLLDFRPKSHV